MMPREDPRLGEQRIASGGPAVPYDYSFRFALEGRPDSTHNQKITISVEAPFVAEAIGYGVVLDRPATRFGPTRPEVVRSLLADQAALPAGFFAPAGADLPLSPRTLTLGSLLLALERTATETPGLGGPKALTRGVRLNLNVAASLLATYDPAAPRGLTEAAVGELFELAEEPPEQVPFLYRFVDEGTGREFQNEPVLSTAGLGSADGGRPFRRFAFPIRFEKRTVIRMEIVEQAAISGTLHVALHGYNLLPGPDVLQERIRRATRARTRRRSG